VSTRRCVHPACADRVLAYVRATDEPQETLLVLLNYGAEPARVILPPGVFQRTPAQLRDIVSNARIRLDRAAPAVDLPAYAVRILATR
jgi:hypothetical protein